jgi:hypothetical protein
MSLNPQYDFRINRIVSHGATTPTYPRQPKEDYMSSNSIYYVYSYTRLDGTPYYIGKGQDRRAYQSHKRQNGSNMLPTDISNIVILHQNLSESQAFELEKKLILEYGRKDLGTGCLRNLTEGGEGNRRVGWNHSEETKKKISQIKRGVPLGPNSVESPMKGLPRSEETKRKISEANKGRVIGCNKKKSEAAKNRKERAWTGKKRPVVTCPHCQKTGADFVMGRWHFDHCKNLNHQD